MNKNVIKVVVNVLGVIIMIVTGYAAIMLNINIYQYIVEYFGLMGFEAFIALVAEVFIIGQITFGIWFSLVMLSFMFINGILEIW